MANSADIANGTVKQVHCLGLELAVFRSDKGEAAILDAYCPHLGANMAAGGTVEGVLACRSVLLLLTAVQVTACTARSTAGSLTRRVSA